MMQVSLQVQACMPARNEWQNVKGTKHPVTLLDHCTLENWTFRSQDHLLPGAKVPGVELSLPGTFQFQKAKVPHLEAGTFAPWY